MNEPLDDLGLTGGAKVVDWRGLLKPEAEPPPSRFKPLRASEITIDGRADYVLKGLFGRRELAAIIGPAGSGKSEFAAHLAHRIAQGAETLYGMRCRGGSVVYGCFEGQAGFRRRLKGLEVEHGPAPDLYLVEQPLNLMARDAPAQVDEFVRAAKDAGAVMIVLDTWAAMCPGADENRSDGASRALALLHEIKDATGALVLFIDHVGLNSEAQERPRGWSGKMATLDAMLTIRGGVKTNDAEAVVSRVKDGDRTAPLVFGSRRVELGFDDEGDPISTFVAVEMFEPHPTASKPVRKRAMTAEAEDAWTAIRDLLVTEGTLVVHSDGTKCQAVSKQSVTDQLVSREALPSRDSVTSETFRQKRHRLLSAIKKAGKIDFDDRYVFAGEHS